GEGNDTFFKVGEDFLKVDKDLRNMPTHFNDLRTEFIKWGEASGSPVIEQDFFKLSADLHNVGHSFSAVGEDFKVIGSNFQEGVHKSDQSFIKFSEDSIKASNDTVKMDASLHALANDFLKVDEVLHKFDVTTIPTPEDTTTHTAATDQLHQILHAD